MKIKFEMASTFIEELQAISAQQNDLDFQLAKLKAEAFDLKLQARDYEHLHQRLQTLHFRHQQVCDDEHIKQSDLKAHLQYLHTNAQSLSREVEELRNIYCEQQQKLGQANETITGHGFLVQERQQFTDGKKVEVKTKHDKCFQLQSQISLRKSEIEEQKAIIDETTLKNKHFEIEIEKGQGDVTTQAKINVGSRHLLETFKEKKDKKEEKLNEFDLDLKKLISTLESRRQELDNLGQQESLLDQQVQQAKTYLDSEQTNIRTIQGTQSRTSSAVDELNLRAQQLQKRANEYDGNIKLLEEQLKSLIFINEKQEENERELISEIRNLGSHSERIKYSNDQLYAEIQSHLQIEREARTKLNKIKMVEQIKARNHDVIAESHLRIKSSNSPQNRRTIPKVGSVYSTIQGAQNDSF